MVCLCCVLSVLCWSMFLCICLLCLSVVLSMVLFVHVGFACNRQVISIIHRHPQSFVRSFLAQHGSQFLALVCVAPCPPRPCVAASAASRLGHEHDAALGAAEHTRGERGLRGRTSANMVEHRRLLGLLAGCPLHPPGL